MLIAVITFLQFYCKYGLLSCNIGLFKVYQHLYCMKHNNLDTLLTYCL